MNILEVKLNFGQTNCVNPRYVTNKITNSWLFTNFLSLLGEGEEYLNSYLQFWTNQYVSPRYVTNLFKSAQLLLRDF